MKQRNIRLITQYALVQHTPICSEKCNHGSNLIPRSRYDLQFTINTLFIVYNGLLVLPNVRAADFFAAFSNCQELDHS